jgi:hypothetical protein
MLPVGGTYMVTEREIQDARRAMRGLDGGKNKKPDLGAYHNWNRKKKLRKRIFVDLHSKLTH